MRKFLISIALLLSLLPLTLSAKQYKYETVPGDPMKVRIYTLDNGLKVYLSENKETPRIQTYIAVKVGGKNDPSETTGLAHYFEHLMFKGTEQFGTSDYAKEKPLLDKIEALFEVYRKTTDPAKRKVLYAQIDSISYEASKYAIPNEYDKLMSIIGATGTNAYTSYDRTVFVENIPSNDIENWAKIEADRFQHNVIRGFHTELETVYEEKNMSLTKDNRKVNEKILAALFPDHPYGKQTVLGTQENLKNPSITNIKNYYKTWYVPNNIAIVMSGDFNSDEVIATIDKYFGNMKSNYNLPKLPTTNANPLTAPVIKTVTGLEAESLMLGWRLPGPKNVAENDLLELTSNILYNGKAGLIDQDLNQQQKTLSSYSGSMGLTDYTAYIMVGRPKEGQTLEQVKDLLLNEVSKLKKGEFDESILTATLNNYKLGLQESLESNQSRANTLVRSFANGLNWKDNVQQIERLSKITKQQIVDFANKYFGDNYALIYKRQGKDTTIIKMEKPAITPIVSNRDMVSSFLKGIQDSYVKPIEPAFLDYDKDIQKYTAKSNIPLLYVKNTTNDLYSLIYVFDMGSNVDKELNHAVNYLQYLGTNKKSLKQINEEFYKLASEFNVSPNRERTYVVLSGLKENMPKAIALFEDLLANAKVDTEAYKEYVANELKQRKNAKFNQASNFRQLQNYAIYGPKNPSNDLLSAEALSSLNPQNLVEKIHNLNSYQHRILYYGPENPKDLLSIINKYHKVPAKLSPVPIDNVYPQLITTENKVLIAPYEANQIYFMGISNRGEKFDPQIRPVSILYNEYFGGGMNTIVFQEMRETRSLAYSASAWLSSPSKLKNPYMYYSYIATQNDKAVDAMNTFNEIINTMPESTKAFNLAKESIIRQLRTQRIIKENILWSYIGAQDLGLNVDYRKQLFNDIQTLTLPDIKKFQEKWVKGRKYTYCILGNEKNLDMEKISKFGKIERVSTEQIFGY